MSDGHVPIRPNMGRLAWGARFLGGGAKGWIGAGGREVSPRFAGRYPQILWIAALPGREVERSGDEQGDDADDHCQTAKLFQRDAD